IRRRRVETLLIQAQQPLIAALLLEQRETVHQLADRHGHLCIDIGVGKRDTHFPQTPPDGRPDVGPRHKIELHTLDGETADREGPRHAVRAAHCRRPDRAKFLRWVGRRRRTHLNSYGTYKGSAIWLCDRYCRGVRNEWG